jgi:uncharacterized DUF497 family protein
MYKYNVPTFAFEWDKTKAKQNLRKHGVSFEEAKSVFYNENALQFCDIDAVGEQRFIMLGTSHLHRLLVVVHCERGENSHILRIISARKATKAEKNFYGSSLT